VALALAVVVRDARRVVLVAAALGDPPPAWKARPLIGYDLRFAPRKTFPRQDAWSSIRRFISSPAASVGADQRRLPNAAMMPVSCCR
jgi:hypothetical protein